VRRMGFPSLPSLMAGETVTVERELATGALDAMGMPVREAVAEKVKNVLVAPGSTSDMAAARPNGDRAQVTFHFPASYADSCGSLAGASVLWGGRRWRVVGDPAPYPAGLCPGPWSMPVQGVATDG